MISNLVIGMLVGAVVGLILVSILRMRTQAAKYFAACEYWIYVPHETLPNQEAVMTAMVAQNPHARPGFTPIGPREGIVFSDIRLHVSMVLRSKNPHTFRPDLFEEGVEVSADSLTALASAKGFVKLRFISESPLPDRRHLTFMVHLADAYARLGAAVAIFDVVSETMYDPAEFHALVGADADAARPDLHVRIDWRSPLGAGKATTRGLIKVGLPEVQTALASPDMRQLVTEVLRETAHQMWHSGSGDGPVLVEYFGDKFEVTLAPVKGGGREAHIVRIQSYS